MTKQLEQLISRDTALCAAMTDELEAYLKSDTLFWEPSRRQPGGLALPKLTIGGFLLSMRRLETLRDHLDPNQRDVLTRAGRELARQRSQWQRRYQSKLERELRSRQDAWAWYLDDVRQQGEPAIAHYAHQVETRVKADLLLEELRSIGSDIDASLTRQAGLDQQLGSVFAVGEFCWIEELTAGFLPDRFWYLWGEPRKD
jgi:ubiquinone biosynthesis protein UbiJ